MIQLMEGFEGLTNMRDLYQSNGLLAYASPSVVVGPGLEGRGQAAQVATTEAAGARPGTGLSPNAMLQIPKSIRELWTSGGVSMGVRVKINDGSRNWPGLQTSTPANVNYSQLAADEVDGVFCLFYKTEAPQMELKYSADGCRTWTVVPMPADFAAPSIYTSVWYESGTLFLSGYIADAAPLYSSQDKGQTWTKAARVTTRVNLVCHAAATGDATYPWLIACNSLLAADTALYLGTGLGPTDTWVKANISGVPGAAQGPTTSYWGRIRKIGRTIYVGCQNGQVVTFDTRIPLGNPAGVTTTPVGSMFQFFAQQYNTFLTDLRYEGGFMWATAAGGQLPCAVVAVMPDIDVLPNALAFNRVTNSSSYYSIAALKGNAMLSDGILLDAQNRMAMNMEPITQLGVTYQVIATSKKIYELRICSPSFVFGGSIVEIDAETGQRTFVTVGTPAETNGSASVNGLGFICPKSVTPGTNLVVYETGSYGFYFMMMGLTALSGSTRQLQLFACPSSGGTSGQNSMSLVGSYVLENVVANPLRYLELTLIANPSAPGQFYVVVRVDGDVVIQTPASYYLGMDTYITNPVFVNLPNNGRMAAYDDLYAADFSGPTNRGNLGVCSVLSKLIDADVQDEWQAPAGTVSHAQLIGGTRSPTFNPEGIIAVEAPTTDVYSTAAIGVPVNTRVAAVRAEVWSERMSVTPPAVKFGLTTESGDLTSTATINTQVQSNSATFEADAEGMAWTPASVDAAEVVLTKV